MSVPRNWSPRLSRTLSWTTMFCSSLPRCRVPPSMSVGWAARCSAVPVGAGASSKDGTASISGHSPQFSLSSAA
ncbi:hypothetical protein [Lysobacter gummosus]|uniref:hypothetical protein n=1 Tax=Lysobacter gummosus TaxID=262324 RepID=UPI003633AF30